MKVLIVDDAMSFRTQIRNIVNSHPGFDVVGSASNGRAALEVLSEEDVDLVTLDLNMPEMDGLETIREMRKRGHNQKIVIFASKTARSAKDTLKALSLGASDFVIKPDGEATGLREILKQVESELLPRLQQFEGEPFPEARERSTEGSKGTPEVTPKRLAPSPTPREEPGPAARETRSQTPALARPARKKKRRRPNDANGAHRFPVVDLRTAEPRLIVIASSTGGPQALEILFSQMKAKPKVPIVVVQHMPEKFTRYLAQRLSSLTGHDFHEAKDNEKLESGSILVAPGNQHVELFRDGTGAVRVKLSQTEKVNSVRPAADITFKDAAKLYGQFVSGFVLTGMGRDGADGCHDIKLYGGAVMIQDEPTSSVWGMPGEVWHCGWYDKMAPIAEIAEVIAHISKSNGV